MSAFINFFIENFASPKEIIIYGPFLLTWSLICLTFSGWLKSKLGVATGYSRKCFHFLIFFSSSLIQTFWGLKMLCMFGTCTACIVCLALFLGSGNLLYEAMAREKDEPHRTWFIIAPLLTTVLGGVLSNIFFGAAAITGYLVAGAGDGIGEVVGTKWGKHKYPVLSLSKVKSWRSIEGSLAVFFVSALMIALVKFGLYGSIISPTTIFGVFIIAFACALTEAITPHGWDNLTMQLVPSLLVVIV